MAITDINISEELETNAPSIKYRGSEGPKSPQQVADALLVEEYEKYVYDLLEQRPDATPMSFEEFRRMVIGEGQMSGGQPLPQDPTKPVNPFQPKPIGPVLPDRQMAAFGGIMGVDGRRQYGLGSSLKKFVRKIIPNEVAEIAVKAAPFVAPFNPLAAGLMSGLGSFDQTGRIGSSLKSGLMNYGLGQAARFVGGADFQKGINPFKGPNFGFSMPTGEGGIKEFFRSKQPAKLPDASSLSGDELRAAGKKYFESPALQAKYGSVRDYQNFIASQRSPNLNFLEKAVSTLSNPFVSGAIGAAGTAALMSMGPEETVSAIMDRGEGMNVESIRAEVQEAFKDPTGEKLAALRVKYPFLGRADTKDMSAMADGGRIGFATGKSLAALLADKTITGSSRRFLERVFGKERFEEMIKGDPDLYRGLLETVEMFRNRDKEGLKMYMQKFLPHMDDATVEEFIIGTRPDIEGIQGQLLRLGSGRDYAGKIDMMKKADNMRKLDNLDVKDLKPNAMGGRITKAEGGLMDLGGLEKDYRNTGGFVEIGAKEKADDVPARLSVNEFVFTADAVRNAGGGDIDKGAQVMENMMKHLEQGGQVSRESQGMSGARDMFAVSERLSEVV